MHIAGIKLNSADDKPLVKLGMIYTDYTGYRYKYVKYTNGDGVVPGVAGQVAFYKSNGSLTTVSCDLSDCVTMGAGVLQSSPDDSQYCWLQVRGPATLSIALVGSPSDGDPLTPENAADGTLARDVAHVEHTCAHVLNASTPVIMCEFCE